MFCSGCGSNVSPGERFCRACGREVTAAAVAAPSGAAPAAVPGAGTQTSAKAIISLICGLLFFVLPAAILAIIFGHLSLSEIRKSAGRLKGEGIAIAGLVLGYLGIAAIPIILIIAAIAIPNLLRARMAANEASAVASIRTLIAAEVAYSGSHQETGYTCSVSDLAEANLITGELVSGRKNGYMFALTDCAPVAAGGPNVKIHVIAYPVTRNQTGVRAFCSDESAVIKSNDSMESCLESGSALE